MPTKSKRKSRGSRARGGVKSLTLLRELEELHSRFDADSAQRKLELLGALSSLRLAHAKQVQRLHEVLCFLRALPDDQAVLQQVETMLAEFAERTDLRRFRSTLADSGIAGTDVHFSFYSATARWLTQHWADRLHIDWRGWNGGQGLKDAIYLLGLNAETPGLDHAKLTGRQWVERFKGPGETDAAFLVRTMAATHWDPTMRDVLFDNLGIPFILKPGPGTPSRSLSRLPGGKTVWQTGALRRGRPDMRREIARPPLSIRSVKKREGQAIIDLARAAMATRARDLDAFAGGDPDDVRLVDCGGGLEFAVVGVQPEWRMLLEAVYGWLILRNRVPVGYVLTSALFNSSEIAYNVFDTWRGGDAAYVYGRVLATTRALFGSDTFTIYPYQLGHGNPEGLASGSWWFYQKLGFRPRDPDVLALMEGELSAMRRRKGHRSSIATLKKLARANVYFEAGRHRATVIGTFPFECVGLLVTDYIAERFGSDRGRAEHVCAADAARLLGVRNWKGFPPRERATFMQWSPLVLALRGIERWSPAERSALVRVMRAKGGRRESDFVKLFDGHRKLRSLLTRLGGRSSTPQ